MSAMLKHRLLDVRNQVVAVAISFVFALFHTGPFYGTTMALLFTIISQVYLPGLLLARALGKVTQLHPVTRFAWILVSGLSLTICLGGAARLFEVPIAVYFILLHSVMLLLALLRPPEVMDLNRWQFSRRNVSTYLLLLACCAIVLAVAQQRGQMRFSSYEDQTVFVAQANWLANEPDDPRVLDRRIGVPVGDTRYVTDGWTYTHAAWTWISGISAAELIWYDLTPLFVWTIPLMIFALTYEITQRETAAAWSAAAITLVGLMTLDSLVYVPTSLAFGQSALFQLNTLRTASTALGLPLALFTAMSYLREPRRRQLIPVFMAGLALASMHPRQVMIFQISVGATLILWWLANPERQRMRQAFALALVVASLAALPYIQRLNRPTSVARTERVREEFLSGASVFNFRGKQFIAVNNVPLIGTTYIMAPQVIFYHPLIGVAVILGLVTGITWRKSLAAQYIVASTIIMLMLGFVPGIVEIFVSVVTIEAAWGIVYALPLAVIFGVSLEAALNGFARITPAQSHGRFLADAVLFAAMLVLLFEPIPIPASARDQIRASNEMQSPRDILRADEQLLSSLALYVPADQRSVILAPNRIANYIIESIPHTFITGGRGNSLIRPFTQTKRFFTESDPVAPWLDTIDLSFITDVNATYIVLQSSDTRLPQVLLQPQRFEYLDSPAGYVIFRVLENMATNNADDLFAQMNDLYGQQIGARGWRKDSFIANLSGDAPEWEPLASGWSEILRRRPENDLARYGLAICYTIMGKMDEALPLWEALHETYPDMSLFSDALAYRWQSMGYPERGVELLLETLASEKTATRVLTAKTLLTEPFFYLLTDEQRRQVVEVADAASTEWHLLAEFDSYDRIRQRVSLLVGAGMWETSVDWLNALPQAEVGPQDLTLQAMIALAQGHLEQALALLYPATDADWRAAKAHIHPDRWRDNTAAQMYYLLAGEIAYREGRWIEAEAAYQEAVMAGSEWAGRYFLSQVWDASGQRERAAELLANIEAEWETTHTEPFPELISLLALADHQALFVLQPEIQRDEDEGVLTVRAIYGNPTGQIYPIREWRIQVTNPTASTHYTSLDVPTSFVEGALVRLSTVIRVPVNVAPLTPARVFIEPRYDNRLSFGSRVLDTVLNRPEAARLDSGLPVVDIEFGSQIQLRSYEVSQNADLLDVTLYWWANTTPIEDYQVFMHLLDGDGQIISQSDSAPVGGRYPTSQWRDLTLIADCHTISWVRPLSAGDYEVRVGLYRLADGARLPLASSPDGTMEDSATIYTFSVGD